MNSDAITSVELRLAQIRGMNELTMVRSKDPAPPMPRAPSLAFEVPPPGQENSID